MRKLKIITAIFSKRKKALKSGENTNLEMSPQILWKSLDELPIRIFYEILKTENVKLLGQGNEKKLLEHWANILEDYWKRTDPVKYKTNIRNSINLVMMQNEINVLIGSVTLAEIGDKRGVEAMLYFKQKTIEGAINRISVLQTKLQIKLLEINKYDKHKSVDFNLFKDVVVLEQILGRSIDIDKITVGYWIELNKLAKKLNNGRNKKR